MSRCGRCGVDFDASPYITGAPCADCQFYEPPNEWLKLDYVKAVENSRRDRHIERLVKRRYSDSEIGEAIGMSGKGVASRRRALGITANVFTGDEKWRDPDAVKEAIGARMRGNSYKQGWGVGQKHGKKLEEN